MKPKNRRALLNESNIFVLGVLVSTILAIIVRTISMQGLWMRSLHERSTPIPVIEESLEVPLNSHGPVYTQNEYSDWVSISISGNVEQNGKLFHDAIHQYEDVQQGSQNGYRGFLIDGIYAFEFQAPGPDYRDDHIYRFPHSVFGFSRSTDVHSPKAIGFQVVNEAARGLEGVFIVEVSSDSFKYWPEARGR